MVKDRSKDSIRSDTHRSTFDTERINRAIERVATGDEQFKSETVDMLRDLQFPAFKHKMLEHVMKKTKDPDTIGLVESLDGYIAFKDTYHVRTAIEGNGEQYKLSHRISDETRARPNFNVRPVMPGQSIKEKEVVRKEEEREDYPEIPPTTPKDYVCGVCGKSFLTRDDLVHHQRFETGTRRKTLAEKRAERVGDITGQPPEAKALNREKAANLANLLEDLEFPATKAEIKEHIGNKRPDQISEEYLDKVVDNLKENVGYESVFEIEVDAGLVKKAGGRHDA